jgi:hypothetical protein
MATPEGRVKDAIKKRLNKAGVWQAGQPQPENVRGWYYMPVPNGMGVHGIPDFVCCIDGRFVGIEAKAPGRTTDTTVNQKKRHAEIHAAGGTILVVDDASQLDVLGI